MWHIDGAGLAGLVFIVFAPALVPWFIGSMAGILSKSKGLKTVLAVSLAGGVASWLLCAGWVALSLLLEWGSDPIVAGLVCIPALSSVTLIVWVARRNERAV